MLVGLARPGLVALGIVVAVLPHPADHPVALVPDLRQLLAVLGVGDGEREATGEVGGFVDAGIVPRWVREAPEAVRWKPAGNGMPGRLALSCPTKRRYACTSA